MVPTSPRSNFNRPSAVRASSSATTAWCSPSAQGTLSSGVLKLVGNASSSALGFLLRDKISSKRAAVYIASSKPYQRSPKKRWPLISPPNGEPVSFSLALINECPVFHISGLPPAFLMATGKRWLHFTSKMIVAPLLRLRMSRAKNITWRSG